MVIIRLSGGLGNQMFQYAFGKALATSFGTELEIDCSLLLDRARGKDYVYRDYDLSIFNVDESFTVQPNVLRSIFRLKSSRIGKRLRAFLARGKHYEKERHFHVDKRLLESPTDNTIYEGWWQSEQYFNTVKDEVRKDFTFKAPLMPEAAELNKRIQSTNSVCLNVRRTDFISNSTLNATDLNYFLRAVEKIEALVETPHFFVFSDDVAWCEEHIKLEHPTEIVQHELKGPKFGNYLRLMTNCKHFIIPNSSFAWWAAWLCDFPNKQVIAPKKWFNDEQYDTSDVTPKDWMRI